MEYDVSRGASPRGARLLCWTTRRPASGRVGFDAASRAALGAAAKTRDAPGEVIGAARGAQPVVLSRVVSRGGVVVGCVARRGRRLAIGWSVAARVSAFVPGVARGRASGSTAASAGATASVAAVLVATSRLPAGSASVVAVVAVPQRAAVVVAVGAAGAAGAAGASAASHAPRRVLPRRSARGRHRTRRGRTRTRDAWGGASLRRLDSPRRSPPLLPEPRSSEMRHPPAADTVTARGRDHAPGRAARKREHRRVAARRVSADAGRRRHSESSVIAGRASWCADRGEMTQREAAEPRTTTWAFAEDAMPRHKDPSYPRAPPAARSSCRRRTHTPRAR